VSVGSLRLIASIILNATGGKIRFGSLLSSTSGDAQNWPIAERQLSGAGGRFRPFGDIGASTAPRQRQALKNE